MKYSYFTLFLTIQFYTKAAAIKCLSIVFGMIFGAQREATKNLGTFYLKIAELTLI